MNSKLESKLTDQFPFLADVYLEVEDGWFQLLYDMFTEIIEVYTDNNLETTDIEVYQLKDKFGTLRIYSNIVHVALPIIHRYELESWIICVKCGEKGTSRVWKGQRYTVCDECFAKLEKEG